MKKLLRLAIISLLTLCAATASVGLENKCKLKFYLIVNTLNRDKREANGGESISVNCLTNNRLCFLIF